jgi:hypothetical protein
VTGKNIIPLGVVANLGVEARELSSNFLFFLKGTSLSLPESSTTAPN